MMRLQIKRWALGLVGVAGGVAASADAVAANEIRGLGRPAGGTYLVAVAGVSGDGSVVVGGNGFAPVSPFRWTSAGGMSLLSQPGDGASDVAWGVNQTGTVVVGKDSADTGLTTAFRWTASGGLVSLGTLPQHPSGSEAYAVDGSGNVVVGNSGGFSGRAFRWTEATGMVALEAATGSPIFSYAYGVSRDGQTIVGSAQNLTGTKGAFRWTQSAGMVPLQGPVGLSGAQANAVSADGGVIAGFAVVSGGINTGIPQSTQAFRWTQATGMVALGELPGGEVYSSANAISDDGTVIVGDSQSAVGLDTFYWTPTGGMQRLWDVLLASGVDPAASGWTGLMSADGVSADGKTIVGYGMHLGRYEGYIVTIPEPAGPATAALFAAALLRRRRPARRLSRSGQTDTMPAMRMTTPTATTTTTV